MKSLWRIARRSFLLWFGAAFLAGGLICLGMGLEGVIEERQFQDQSRSAEGVVLRKSTRPQSNGENSSTKHEITYSFLTEDGRTVEGTDVVSPGRWESLAEGSRFEIRYLAAKPQFSRAAGSSSMETSVVAIALGSLFAIVGGFFFFRNATHVWNQWSILRTGDATLGSVIEIAPTSAEVNNVRQWQVRYRYRDHFGRIHEGSSGDVTPGEARTVAVGENINVRFNRERQEQSVWVQAETAPAAHDIAEPAEKNSRPSSWRQLGKFAGMLGLVFVAVVLGEIVVPITGVDRFIAKHETALTAATVASTALGFALFMGGIVYRIFAGSGERMSHADVEDLSGRTSFQRGPTMARASTYRFKGKSAGSSFHDEFSVKEAKDAWKERAWRGSPRWRGNFIIMMGVLLFAVGLFSIFIVIGPNGIRLMCAAAVTYALARTIVAICRA